jgi:glycosyltransferase involved in cell wall biosynthesis
VHTDHGRQTPDPWKARLVDRLAAKRTDVVVAVSEALAEQLGAGIVPDRSRIRVVRNGVDTESYRPHAGIRDLRTELGIPATAPVLGSIGRLEPIKGYDVMVEAFARLRARWQDGEAPHLLVAGDGSERERLLRAAVERGVADAVHLPGWRDDVHDLHAAFTVFTMSSHSEGTSVSLLEAMSAGLCPVVTDVGGNAAVLGGDLRHRLVRPDDPEALATAWISALQAGDRREVDARLARARVVEAFSLTAMVGSYERLYATGA